MATIRLNYQPVFSIPVKFSILLVGMNLLMKEIILHKIKVRLSEIYYSIN